MSKVRIRFGALAARLLYRPADPLPFKNCHHPLPRRHPSLPPPQQIAFRSLLSIVPTVIQHPVSPTQPQPAFSLIFEENPLTDFVELPEEAVEGGLCYAKILEGVIRGSLEMVSWSFGWLVSPLDSKKLIKTLPLHRSKPQ